MIIGRSSFRDEDGHPRELLMLGLSKENIRRMQKGQPVKITQESHGPGVPAGWTITIMCGETEIQMMDALAKEGLVGPLTKINVDPRLIAEEEQKLKDKEKN